MRARAGLVSGRSTRTTSSRSACTWKSRTIWPVSGSKLPAVGAHDDAPPVADDAELLERARDARQRRAQRPDGPRDVAQAHLLLEELARGAERDEVLERVGALLSRAGPRARRSSRGRASAGASRTRRGAWRPRAA